MIELKKIIFEKIFIEKNISRKAIIQFTNITNNIAYKLTIRN